MSTARKAVAMQVAEFTTEGKRKSLKKDQIPFKIDGEMFYLIRPKQYDLAQIAMALESGVPLDDARNLRVMLRYCAQMVRYIADEPATPGVLHGRARIEERLSDPEDSFDLATILPILTGLMRGWFNRPTGSPPASTVSRRPATVRAASATPGSRARTRSTRAKT